MEPNGNSIKLSTFVKYDLTEVKKSSIVDVRLGSKICLCEHNFTRFYIKKNKILRVHVKDKSSNNPESLQLY